jgi:RecB family exonuclease
MRTLELTPSPTRAAGADPAALVVTPNPRAAAALGVAFASLASLARERLRSAGLLVATELVQRRALRRALIETLAPDDLEGTVRRYAPTIREALRAGPQRPPTEALSERARQLLTATDRYRALLAERGQIDPAEALWAAAERVSQPRPLRLVGYPRLGRGEVAFVDALAADGSRLLLPPEDRSAAEALTARGWRLERSAVPPQSLGDRLAQRLFGAADPPLPEVEAYRFDDQEAEVRFVLARVKALLHGGTPAERIALIARDERLYGPTLEAVAWELELPLVLSYALPLAETRLGAWLTAAAEVVRTGAPFEATARLLAHPLGGGLEREVWAQARSEHPNGVGAWRELDPRIGLLVWPASGSRSELLERLFGALDAFGVRERLPPVGRDALAALRFASAAPTLAEPAEERISVGAFLGELAELLQLLTVPVGAGREGVALHSPLAVYGASFDHLFVLGLVEGVTPAPVRDDPLLDFHARARLAHAGLPLEGALEAAEREAVSFAAMLRSVRGRLLLSSPRMLGGRARIPSPYLERLGVVATPPPVRGAASLEEARRLLLQSAEPSDDAALIAARHAWRVELDRESAAPPGSYDGVIGVGRDPERWPFSASQLVALGQCPFKWFARRLLRLAEPDEADDDESPLLRGRLWHRTLETALRRADGADDPRAEALAQLEAAFAEAEADEGVPKIATWPQRRLEHLQQLRHAVAAADFWTKGGEVVALEQRFEAEWRGLRVSGVVDRIDRNEQGLRLIDYKTRASAPTGAKDASGRARLDLQLPLYVEAAAPALFPGEPVAAASYLSLTAARELRRPKLDEAALDELAERVGRHLAEGSYPVDPDEDRRACAVCPYDALCRQGPRIERKRGAAGDR